ncbi:MAG: T9SS type A sorting domain-containing protein [Flavobacteriaceae bacterium]|nr:T9SS type A sorting domain-containing protein [Flavobacteriaceae bacterium]
MKKIYLLALAAFALSFTVNAQIIDDNFEFYTLGNMGDQNPGIWNNWSNDPLGAPDENITVVDDTTIDAKSGFIGNGGIQDAFLYFDGGVGGLSSGDYTVVWQMFINAGSEGYFNVQGTIDNDNTTGVWNSGDIYFNQGGANAGGITDTASGETGTFPHDEWFEVSIYFDLEASGGPTYEMSTNGNLMHTTPVLFQDDAILGGIDFFSSSAFTEYWIDNVLFVEGRITATDDFSADKFSVYPNPVQDVLNIRSTTSVDAITIYDVLGKLVLATTPDAISPSIDMSALASGAYLVKVTIDGASKTVKVIK